MSDRRPRLQTQPGYLAYLPSSYQFLGPEQDQLLDQIICSNPANAADNDGFAEFWVKTPNVRCRTRVSFVLEPNDVSVDPNTALNTVILDGTGLLWAAEHERTRSGRPQMSPIRNVVGTGATPLAIPTDTRLWGFTFEVETNGQELYGQFTPPAIKDTPAAASLWHILVRYESVQRLSDEEWNQFKQRYGLRIAPEKGLVLT